jgi:putative tryptophan/tyrosine transport system substrate-binding protein
LAIPETRHARKCQQSAARIVVLSSPLVLDNRARIATLAIERKLPTVFLFAQAAEAGGLIAYGPSVNDMSRRAARIVTKVLNGAQPAELPISTTEPANVIPHWCQLR